MLLITIIDMSEKDPINSSSSCEAFEAMALDLQITL